MSRSVDLRAENQRLATRVAELEAQLAASPFVDRSSLFRMTDAAPWGALVLNREGRIDYANPAFQPWLLKPAPASGEAGRDVIAPELLAVIEQPVRGALSGNASTVERDVPDWQGEMRSIRATVAPRGAGLAGITGCVISLYDLTDSLALDRSVRENEARLRHINTVTPSVIYIADVVLRRPVWVGGRAGSILGYTSEEIADPADALRRGLVHPDDLPRLAGRLLDLEKRPDGEVIELELRARRKDGAYRWLLDRAAVFERDAAGRVVKTISAAIDIDERKRADEHRTLLINELNHRVKNTLSAVQSIARQTLRSDRAAELTIELFTERLVALSAAHDVLTREHWEGAGLRQIVEETLRPFVTDPGRRISVTGPDVRLGSRAVIGLAMALHELATNALEHGALSVETGRVDLSWRARPRSKTPRLELVWRERDGPAVTPPVRAGFGSRLLSQGLPAELDGSAELSFNPAGFVCRITAPLGATPTLSLA